MVGLELVVERPPASPSGTFVRYDEYCHLWMAVINGQTVGAFSAKVAAHLFLLKAKR